MDMQISSGKNRFFVYDMDNNSVAAAGLVAHGDGSDNGSGKLSFSNTPNSHCTSLGKYRIGSSYNGTFGLAYKLYGLDKSNSKAFDRFVVLHAHSCVPDAEVAPARICLSQGCPTVSPVFLRKLRSFIDGSEQPILLWIYD
jgi:L,D-transpeptidase catalytic domain